MRITIVHNFYSTRVPSGENSVVNDQVAALTVAGHDIAVVARQNSVRNGPGRLVKAAAVVATGRGGNPLAEIRATDPDVVHVHNLFPHLGHAWVRDLDVPLVVTLHNFRQLCAADTFFRQGRECYDCLSQSTLHAVRHRCAGGSVLQTLPLAIATSRRARDPLLVRADVLLTLSERAAGLFAEAGAPRDKLRITRNFLPTSRDLGSGPGGPSWLFAGRLDPTKGIRELLSEWPSDVPLTVVGDGPLKEEVVARCSGAITFRGPVSRSELFRLMQVSRGLVLPSLWVEGFPTVHIEALAAGTPVLAWEPTSSASFIQQAGGGRVAGRRGELAALLVDLEREFADQRGRCRQLFEEQFSQDVFVAQCERWYELAGARFRAGKGELDGTAAEPSAGGNYA